MKIIVLLLFAVLPKQRYTETHFILFRRITIELFEFEPCLCTHSSSV